LATLEVTGFTLLAGFSAKSLTSAVSATASIDEALDQIARHTSKTKTLL
jgi:hypothetical protein